MAYLNKKFSAIQGGCLGHWETRDEDPSSGNGVRTDSSTPGSGTSRGWFAGTRRHETDAEIQQELLHLHLEPPERGTALDVILAAAPVQHLQETESVEDGMVTAEIGGVLLVAFALVDLVIFIDKNMNWGVKFSVRFLV